MDASGQVGEPQLPLETIIQIIHYGRLFNYMIVASAVALFVDHIHTFSDEVELVWFSKMAPIKYLYFIPRYCGPILIVISFFYYFDRSITDEGCLRLFMVIYVLGILNTMSAESLLYLQVYAMAKRHKFVKIWLVLQWLALLGVHIYLQAALFIDSKYIASKLPDPNCLPLNTQTVLVGAAFAIASANQLILMIFALVFAKKNYHAQSTVLSIVLENGLIYWCVNLSLAIATTIMSYAGPPEIGFILAVPLVVLHSILPTRGVLALREFSSSGLSIPVTDNSNVAFVNVSNRRGATSRAENSKIDLELVGHELRSMKHYSGPVAI